jgi:hypothetical protein
MYSGAELVALASEGANVAARWGCCCGPPNGPEPIGGAMDGAAPVANGGIPPAPGPNGSGFVKVGAPGGGTPMAAGFAGPGANRALDPGPPAFADEWCVATSSSSLHDALVGCGFSGGCGGTE